MSITTELNDLLVQEAHLLDEWQLDDWLHLYDEDAIYWLPIDDQADPETTPSIIHERKVMLMVRVEQLMRQNRHAQSPRGEFMRSISNLHVEDHGDGTASARYHLMCVEVRPGDWRQAGLGQKRFFAGRCEVRVKRTDGRWLITRKVIKLLDRFGPIESLSFIL